MGISGIFDLESIARSMQMIIDRLRIDALRPTTDAGRDAQATLVDQADEEAVLRQRSFMERLRAQAAASAADGTGLRPFMLGVTIDFEYAQTVTGPRIVSLRQVA